MYRSRTLKWRQHQSLLADTRAGHVIVITISGDNERASRSPSQPHRMTPRAVASLVARSVGAETPRPRSHPARQGRCGVSPPRCPVIMGGAVKALRSPRRALVDRKLGKGLARSSSASLHHRAHLGTRQDGGGGRVEAQPRHAHGMEYRTGVVEVSSLHRPRDD